MSGFNYLAELPGPPEYQAWLKERLETLSVRESYVLAALTQQSPNNVVDAVDRLRSLDDCEVCFPAGSYEQLGEYCAKRGTKLPDSVLPYVDMEQLGQIFEDSYPGLFIGSCYISYPKQDRPAIRQENGLPLLWDDDWSVKLKLASPAIPKGVWLRLPDHDGNMAEHSNEVKLALDALRVESLEDCTVLEARCILPEAGSLMEQYDSATELVRDGDSLGFVLDEQGQGEPNWLKKFAAALEYEGCHTLKFALDISQNLHCYEWISSEGLADFAARHLRDEGVPEELIQSGAINLDDYAEDLLETSGYMQTSGETGYMTRNNRQFIYEYSGPSDSGMTMQ